MSSKGYSRSEWTALSIQDRIRAMNETLDDDVVETIPSRVEEHDDDGALPPTAEPPQRTSVVDMWRKRDTSSYSTNSPTAEKKGPVKNSSSSASSSPLSTGIKPGNFLDELRKTSGKQEEKKQDEDEDKPPVQPTRDVWNRRSIDNASPAILHRPSVSDSPVSTSQPVFAHLVDSRAPPMMPLSLEGEKDLTIVPPVHPRHDDGTDKPPSGRSMSRGRALDSWITKASSKDGLAGRIPSDHPVLAVPMQQERSRRSTRVSPAETPPEVKGVSPKPVMERSTVESTQESEEPMDEKPHVPAPRASVVERWSTRSAPDPVEAPLDEEPILPTSRKSVVERWNARSAPDQVEAPLDEEPALPTSRKSVVERWSARSALEKEEAPLNEEPASPTSRKSVVERWNARTTTSVVAPSNDEPIPRKKVTERWKALTEVDTSHVPSPEPSVDVVPSEPKPVLQRWTHRSASPAHDDKVPEATKLHRSNIASRWRPQDQGTGETVAKTKVPVAKQTASLAERWKTVTKSVPTDSPAVHAPRAAIAKKSDQVSTTGMKIPGENVAKSLLVLKSGQSLSREVVSVQDKVDTILRARRIPCEELDGAIASNRKRRSDLFALSGAFGRYPQFFLVSTDGTTEFWGDQERFFECNDNGTLVEDLGVCDIPRAMASSVSVQPGTPGKSRAVDSRVSEAAPSDVSAPSSELFEAWNRRDRLSHSPQVKKSNVGMVSPPPSSPLAHVKLRHVPSSPIHKKSPSTSASPTASASDEWKETQALNAPVIDRPETPSRSKKKDLISMGRKHVTGLGQKLDKDKATNTSHQTASVTEFSLASQSTAPRLGASSLDSLNRRNERVLDSLSVEDVKKSADVTEVPRVGKIHPFPTNSRSQAVPSNGESRAVVAKDLRIETVDASKPDPPEDVPPTPSPRQRLLARKKELLEQRRKAKNKSFDDDDERLTGRHTPVAKGKSTSDHRRVPTPSRATAPTDPSVPFDEQHGNRGDEPKDASEYFPFRMSDSGSAFHSQTPQHAPPSAKNRNMGSNRYKSTKSDVSDPFSFFDVNSCLSKESVASGTSRGSTLTHRAEQALQRRRKKSNPVASPVHSSAREQSDARSIARNVLSGTGSKQNSPANRGSSLSAQAITKSSPRASHLARIQDVVDWSMRPDQQDMDYLQGTVPEKSTARLSTRYNTSSRFMEYGSKRQSPRQPTIEYEDPPLQQEESSSSDRSSEGESYQESQTLESFPAERKGNRRTHVPRHGTEVVVSDEFFATSTEDVQALRTAYSSTTLSQIARDMAGEVTMGAIDIDKLASTVNERVSSIAQLVAGRRVAQPQPQRQRQRQQAPPPPPPPRTRRGRDIGQSMSSPRSKASSMEDDEDIAIEVEYMDESMEEDDPEKDLGICSPLDSAIKRIPWADAKSLPAALDAGNCARLPAGQPSFEDPGASRYREGKFRTADV